MSDKCIERIVSGSATNYGERLHSANHHEWRYLKTELRYRNVRNAQYETPTKVNIFYCIFCRKIVENE